MTVFSEGFICPGPDNGPGKRPVPATNSPLDLAALYTAHRLPLARIAVLLVHDTATAEDLVHDAFIALQQHQSKLRDPGAALGYLRTTVVNKSRSVLRKRQTIRQHLKLVRDSYAEPADSELLIADSQRELLAAVRQLPRRQQEVLVLRYWADLSEGEIADALGISRGAVKSNASRGMDKLEAMLGGKPMSQLIEDRLRDAFQAKAMQLTEQRLDQLAAARTRGEAESFGSMPDWRLATGSPRSQGQPPWVAAVLAAVAVIALAIGILAVAGTRQGSRPHPNPPASQLPTAPAPSSSGGPTRSTTVAVLPYLPAGQTGDRSQVPWSVVGSGWRLLQPYIPLRGGSSLYLYDPVDGRYLITDALPAGSSLQGWSPDGRRAMLAVGQTLQQLDLRTGAMVSKAVLPGYQFRAYPPPGGTAMLVSKLSSTGDLLQRRAFDGRLEQTYTDPSEGLSGTTLYSPDGQLILGPIPSTPLVFDTDGHLLRRLPVPAGYAGCEVDKWWTASTMLERCVMERNGPVRFALFMQPLAGGTPTLLADGPGGSKGTGYDDAWQLSNGDVLLEVDGDCDAGGYQIRHAGSDSFLPLQLPDVVPSPQHIFHMDNDVATFRGGNAPCAAEDPQTLTLLDYNLVTGQTATIFQHQDAFILSWPGDQS